MGFKTAVIQLNKIEGEASVTKINNSVELTYRVSKKLSE